MTTSWVFAPRLSPGYQTLSSLMIPLSSKVEEYGKVSLQNVGDAAPIERYTWRRWAEDTWDSVFNTAHLGDGGEQLPYAEVALHEHLATGDSSFAEDYGSSYRALSTSTHPLSNEYEEYRASIMDKLAQGLAEDAAEQQLSRAGIPLRPVWRSYKRYLPTTNWTISFTLLALAQCVACISLEICILTQMQGYEELYLNMTVPAQFVTVVFESLYQVVLTLDAVKIKNTIQIFGVCLNNVAILVFAGLAVAQVQDLHSYKEACHDSDTKCSWTTYLSIFHPLFSVLLAVIGVFSVGLCLLAWKLYDEFAWAIYRHIPAANLQLRRRYMMYEVRCLNPIHCLPRPLTLRSLIFQSRSYTLLECTSTSSSFSGSGSSRLLSL